MSRRKYEYLQIKIRLGFDNGCRVENVEYTFKGITKDFDILMREIGEAIGKELIQ